MRLRVLVVDDARPVADLHGRFVAAHPGCELVGTAATGPEAVDAMRTLTPDLVLLDVHLPGFSGLDALRRIRADASLPQPDVIAVTAARNIDTVRSARLMGVRHYIVKPFTARELHDRIDDVLRERARLPHESTSLDQTEVDAVMRPTDRRPLPKGLSPETLQLVAAALADADDASAADIAQAVGLSRVSCRRYLEHLADTGLATRTLDYSTSGRPGTRYRLVGAV